MSRLEKIWILNSLLLEEMPEYRQQAERFAEDMESQRRLLRSLMNVRYPGKRLNLEFLHLQDELLAEEREEKRVVDVMELPAVNSDSRISLWQGGYYTAECGCYCECGQFADAWLLHPMPCLY